MAMIYDNERMQNSIRNGKSTWIEVQEKPNVNFQESSPNGITNDGLNPATSCDNVGEVLSIRKLIRDSELEVSIGLLANRLWEGRRMFSINHIVKQCRHIEPLLSVRKLSEIPSSQVPTKS